MQDKPSLAGEVASLNHRIEFLLKTFGELDELEAGGISARHFAWLLARALAAQRQLLQELEALNATELPPIESAMVN